MKKQSKAFLLFESVLAALVIVLAFAMVRENSGEDWDKVSVILQDSDASRWAAFKYGLRMASEDQKVELVVVSTGNKLTVEEQKHYIEREIENGADAVIVQPISEESSDEMLDKVKRKIPVMLVGTTASEERTNSGYAVTGPDYFAMGQRLAEELLLDYSVQSMKGKKLGIVMETDRSEISAAMEEGFLEGLGDLDVEIVWRVSGIAQEDGGNSLETLPKADLVIALDDSSLILAGECAAANNLHGAVVYGIGNSTEAVYYLDIGAVECLVVSDEFDAGYQSMTEIAENLAHRSYRMRGITVSYTVIRKETLFLKETQDILFTMSQ